MTLLNRGEPDLLLILLLILGPPENLCSLRSEIRNVTVTCPFRYFLGCPKSERPEEGNVTVASLVRKTLALRNHRVASRVTQDAGRLVVFLALIRRRMACSSSSTFGKVRDCLGERGWRHVALWGFPVEFRYRPVRVDCELCGPRVEAERSRRTLR